MNRLLLLSTAALMMLGCASTPKPTSSPVPSSEANSGAAEKGATDNAAGTKSDKVSDPAADEVRYYGGAYTTMSPDGKQPYGPPVPVVGKRTLKKNDGLILEVLDMPKRHFDVTLTRTEGSTFTGTDAGKTWTGTIEYSGEEWGWNSWTYAIKLTDGSGTLKGKGSLEDGKMETDKTFYDPSGAAKARILESLNAVTAAEYEAKLAAVKKLGKEAGKPEGAKSAPKNGASK